MAKIPKILSRKYTPPRFNCLSPWFIWNYTCMRIHHFQLYPTTHIYLSIYLSIHLSIYLSMCVCACGTNISIPITCHIKFVDS
jgi:hypothetical protein